MYVVKCAYRTGIEIFAQGAARQIHEGIFGPFESLSMACQTCANLATRSDVISAWVDFPKEKKGLSMEEMSKIFSKNVGKDEEETE